MCHVPSVVNDIWCQIYAPLNGCSELGRYKGNCKFLLKWFRNGFSWSSYDLRFVPVLYLPTFSESNAWDVHLVMTKISGNVPATSEDFRRIPEDFIHFFYYSFTQLFGVVLNSYSRKRKSIVPVCKKWHLWLKGPERLGKHLECAVCLEQYTEPKVLPCLHSFVSEDFWLEREQSAISFPTCRSIAEVSFNNS